MWRYVKHFIFVLLAVLLVANEAGFLPPEEALDKAMHKAWGKITGLDVTAQMPTAAASEVPPELLQIIVPKVQAYGPIDGQGAVDVRTFGAKGDGREDDTISIQAAIDSLLRGETFYAHNLGLPELRAEVAAYTSRLHRPVGADRAMASHRAAAQKNRRWRNQGPNRQAAALFL